MERKTRRARETEKLELVYHVLALPGLHLPDRRGRVLLTSPGNGSPGEVLLLQPSRNLHGGRASFTGTMGEVSVLGSRPAHSLKWSASGELGCAEPPQGPRETN